MAKDCPHEHECFNRFDKIDKSLEEIKTFVWRGKSSMAMEVDRNTRFRRVMSWVTGAITLSSISVGLRALAKHFSGH